MEMLAHSAKPEYNIKEQSYSEHINNVISRAGDNARHVASYYVEDGQLLYEAVRLAAAFHDLGKLDSLNQNILSGKFKGKLLNHVDAGSAVFLSNEYSNAISCLLVFSHHLGLPDIVDEINSPAPFRDRSETEIARKVIPFYEYSNNLLNQYLDIHKSIINDIEKSHFNLPNNHQMLLRIALSCLVDADHFDTAKNYNSSIPQNGLPLFPEKRLELLDNYITNLATSSDSRNNTRQKVYETCKYSTIQNSIVACDSPVGTGKTTAIMAFLLNKAKTNNLRRIFVVLPFTNIIDQSVEVYQNALVDQQENKDDVVAAHHHKAEFDDESMRQYSFLWHAPIIVTTAVQFFETLASCSTSSLRKLHNLPGSAIFIDESHAALPAKLWPMAWKWLKELANNWNCHIVLGSGSLSRFWELEEFENDKIEIPDLVSCSVTPEAYEYENTRVKYNTYSKKFDLIGLIDFIKEHPGPRLLIVNTVHSAAVIASKLSETESVEHLSTSLCPADRLKTLVRIKERLKDKKDTNWTLVATSCVEAGVNFSFRTGLRERSSFTSLIQTAGRVNRNGEYTDSVLWDIQLNHDGKYLKKHPAFDVSASVLGKMFSEKKIDAKYTTEAIKREIRSPEYIEFPKNILIAEKNSQFPIVESLFKVINTDTKTVIVKEHIIEKINDRYKVSNREIMNNSVQILSYKLHSDLNYGVEEISHMPNLYKWNRDYDDFLGYMAGIVHQINRDADGYAIL